MHFCNQLTYLQRLQHIPSSNFCQGDCDDDLDCAGDLKCFKRSNGEDVPGCIGNTEANAGLGTDYCYDNSPVVTPNPTNSPDTSSPTKLGKTSSPSKSPVTLSPTTSDPTVSPSQSPETSSPSKSPSLSPVALSPTTSDPTVSQGESPVTSSPSKTPTIVLPVLEKSRILPLGNW